MNTFARSLIGFLIGWFIGFLCMLPFWYALAHGSEQLIYVPLIFACIGGVVPYFLRSSSRRIQYLGYFVLFCILFTCVLIFYYLVLAPKWNTANIMTTVQSIRPSEISYQPITWSWKNIGVTVQAKFTMNPDIQEIIPHSNLPELPWISLNPYNSLPSESRKIDWVYLLSWSVLLPQVFSSDSGYCFRRDEYTSPVSLSWITSGNLLYPYIEGACSRWWECFTRYEIPWTEFTLDIDPFLYTELPECKNYNSSL